MKSKLPLGTRGRYLVVFLFIRFSDLLVASARKKKKQIRLTSSENPLRGGERGLQARPRDARGAREKIYARSTSVESTSSVGVGVGGASVAAACDVGRSVAPPPPLLLCTAEPRCLFRFETCTLRDIRRPDFRVYAPDRHVATRRGRSVGHGTHNDRS